MRCPCIRLRIDANPRLFRVEQKAGERLAVLSYDGPPDRGPAGSRGATACAAVKSRASVRACLATVARLVLTHDGAMVPRGEIRRKFLAATRCHQRRPASPVHFDMTSATAVDSRALSPHSLVTTSRRSEEHLLRLLAIDAERARGRRRARKKTAVVHIVGSRGAGSAAFVTESISSLTV